MNTDFETWFSLTPKTRKCDEHQNVTLQLREDETRQQCGVAQHSFHWSAVYETCPECRELKTLKRLVAADVPPALLHCTLENWTPADGQEQHLSDVREYAEKIRRGFLPLLGPVGVGKTHLAIAALRHMKLHGYFVKQSTLLANLRATYNDKNAENPIRKCKKADVLILDEIGFQPLNLKDEFPMLHEILDYRYNHLLPTIITSNLTWDDLRNELGERIADRLKESAWKVLVISGASHRPTRRDSYFSAPMGPKKESLVHYAL